MIYARKSEEFEQVLEEHIEECLKALEELKNTRFWKLIRENEVELRTAIVFHDSGKIFYQKNFKKGKLSFEGHEICSAHILDTFAWHYKKYAKEISDLSTAAVLYHHHAMGVKKRANNLRKIKLKFSNQKEFEEILAEHEKILLKHLRFFEPKAVEKALDDMKSNLRKFFTDNRVNTVRIVSVCEEIISRVWERFQKDVDFRKKMIALTTALVVCDYRGVKGKRTEFGGIIDEFVELYSRKPRLSEAGMTG